MNYSNPWLSRIMSILLIIIFIFSCSTLGNKKKKSQIMDTTDYQKGTFGYDLQFLGQFIDPVILQGAKGNARIIISREWQGRVMTSTADGMKGNSYGWINYELVKSGEIQAHINAFGGEDRLWLGPEGGQFSIYFKQGAAFDFNNWFVPKELDTEVFELVESGPGYANFEKHMNLVNYSGFPFDLRINRNIKLLSQDALEKELGMKIPSDIRYVAYESVNTITNTGNNAWTKETGLLSIWILGMFTPSPGVTILIPYKTGSEIELGPVVNDTYFGKISSERLKVEEGIIYFRGDGKSRGKIGLSPLRAKPVAASYDKDNHTLTIVQFSLPEGVTDYVNSMWEIQDEPFKGDAVNSYNDGPLEDGGQMGPFYELESSSPAASLAPGKSLEHIHRTCHFQGEEEALDEISRAVLGIGIEDIKKVF